MRWADAVCAFIRRQHFYAWTDVMTAILKLWPQIKIELCQSMHIYSMNNPGEFLSRSDLKRRSIRLFWRSRPNNKKNKKNRMSSDYVISSGSKNFEGLKHSPFPFLPYSCSTLSRHCTLKIFGATLQVWIIGVLCTRWLTRKSCHRSLAFIQLVARGQTQLLYTNRRPVLNGLNRRETAWVWQRWPAIYANSPACNGWTVPDRAAQFVHWRTLVRLNQSVKLIR